jgi:hypothetical protein
MNDKWEFCIITTYLTDLAALTTQAVRRPLASKDDSAHRQLRINKAGVAYLSDDTGTFNLDGVAHQFEIGVAGMITLAQMPQTTMLGSD